MANRSINNLDNASTLADNDLLVLWQSATNTAKNMTGQQFAGWLANLADGHGGITSIAGPVTSGLNKTYTITMADDTTFSFTVTDGAKGDTGAQTYVYIRYALRKPTSDEDVSVIPGPWIGFCSTTASTAPTSYTAYTWYEMKGPPGDGVAYTAYSTDETGMKRTYTMYTSNGVAVGSFTVTDGSGAVSTVNSIAPVNGDVSTTVGSVEDLGLTAGSATIVDAYALLRNKQCLIAMATDFALGELPLVGGNRLTDGYIEIVKLSTNNGWIEFHGRSLSVGDYRMSIESIDSPVWVRTTPTYDTTQVTVINGSTLASGSHLDGTFTLTRAGYKPIAVAGWFFDGNRSDEMRLVRCRINTTNDGLQYWVRNVSSGASTGFYLYVTILWEHQ